MLLLVIVISRAYILKRKIKKGGDIYNLCKYNLPKTYLLIKSFLSVQANLSASIFSLQ